MAKRWKQKKRKLRARTQRPPASPSLDELKAYVEGAAKEGLVSKTPWGSGVAVLVPAESKLPLPAPSFGVDRSTLIRPGKHRYGPDIGGKIEYAQKALLSRFPHALPVRATSKLTRDIDADVRRDYPEFAATCRETKDGLVMDRETVQRALDRLREVNS
jgi:hypothetical protein